MKIAIFTSKFPLISETFVINQIIGLIDLGVEVDIIANEKPDHDLMHDSVEKYALLEKLQCIGLNTKKSKRNRILSTLLNSASLIAKGKYRSLINVSLDSELKLSQKMNLISALKRFKGDPKQYDNIICHFGLNGYYVCKMRELGLISGPVSTIFHGYEVSHYKVVDEYLSQYKCLFKKGDLMLPISKLWGNKLIEWGCHPSKVKIHRMGIDVDEFELRDTLRPLSKPLKIIQVGRLTEKKAILDSINAVALASKIIDIDFTIIGDGDLFAKADELIKSLGADCYIHLLGQQPQTVVKRKLDEADVFLLPSVRATSGDMEGIPVSLMEAMAKGLITVSTYHSGIPELIENEASGFLVQEHSVSELSEVLIKIASLSQVELEKIRLLARTTCLDEYNNGTLNHSILGLL
ncbi:glycosyltransferase [Vibrio parahaemolyticus]|nr:glycosyltransferase [Vibrio parahaemolyticus]